MNALILCLSRGESNKKGGIVCFLDFFPQLGSKDIGK